MIQELATALTQERHEQQYAVIRILLDLEEVGGWRPLIEMLRGEHRSFVEPVLIEIGDDVVLRFLRQVAQSRSQKLATYASRLRREIYLDRELFLRIWLLPERSAEQQRHAIFQFYEAAVRRRIPPQQRLATILRQVESDRIDPISQALSRLSRHFFAEARSCTSEEALLRLGLCLMCSPANALAMLARAEIRLQRSELNAALMDYRNALQLLPGHQALAHQVTELERRIATIHPSVG
jgi:hypothetical protein